MENTSGEKAAATNGTNGTTIDDDLEKLKNEFFRQIDEIINTLRENEPLLQYSIADLERQKAHREELLSDYKKAYNTKHNGTSH